MKHIRPQNSIKDSERRLRRVSWEYDEDHHIGQYPVENTLLPINENGIPPDYDDDNSYDYSDCDEYESDGCGTYNVNGIEFSETEVVNILYGEESNQQNQQNPLHNNAFDTAVRRRRRKVLGKAWQIPPPAVMQRRNRFRQNVQNETKRHRRIIPRNIISDNNQDRSTADAWPTNVLHLLRDREVFGGGTGSGETRRKSMRGGESTFRVGGCIKSTEFDDDSTTKRRRRRRRRHRSQETSMSAGMDDPSAPPLSPVTVTIAPDDEVVSIRRTNSIQYSTSHCRSITNELRTYAEQVCVTKFESSYLSHLQNENEIVDEPIEVPVGDTAGDGENNGDTNNSNSNANPIPQQNVNTSSKAVSTISIAFSPDGKTMASTHGDHTVKITCCMTGKLLQTLVGHPRTPWTVKYHPHAGAHTKNPIIIANSSNSATNNNNNATSNLLATSQDDQPQQEQRQQIVASGCLGHQVRIWDWISGTCLQMIRLEYAIISLSFHPQGSILAIANGTRLHFWDLPTVTQVKEENSVVDSANHIPGTNEGQSLGVVNQNDNSNRTANSRSITTPSRGMHIEMRHMLRCVHFLPDGKKVIVGGVNPQSRAEIQRQRRLAAEGNQEKFPTMSFYLRLWDFDLDAAKGITPPPEASDNRRQAAHILNQVALASQDNRGSTIRDSSSNNQNIISGNNTTQQRSILESNQAAAAANNIAGLGATRRRRAISNPRCFVPRALLYNDGGFDVSPDGKTLCACAEYWLPEGVDNATDLIHPPERDDEDEDFDFDCSSSDCSNDGEDDSNNNDNDVTMDDVSGEGGENQKASQPRMSEADKGSIDAANSSGGVISTGKNDDQRAEDSKDKEGKSSDVVNDTSPSRKASSSLPSATPPRIASRQPQQISSPPLAAGVSTGTGSTRLPMPPMQVGLTPQTPPPNVNPLNFPLSPPSPPGRRFAGGLGRGAQSSSQQHEQLLQQYNRQQSQHRQNQQQQIIPPPQHPRGSAVSTPPGRGTESTTTTIPAPPGINHRNHRQHRLHNQQQPINSLHKAGNPFATTSRKNANVPRGRFVPHVVTISLDTEPYVETTTVEVKDDSVSPNSISGDVGISSAHERTLGGHISATSMASTPNIDVKSTTTTVTKTTYNIPGRHAAAFATDPHVLERRPRLGQLLSACPLDVAKASAVTCVKYSPCTDFCLIGYGVREPHVEDSNGESNDSQTHPPYHPVTAMYKVNIGGSMKHVSTMLSGDDDVNIARFHPDSGYGFVYGTKQGRIRILGPRPWNYYTC